MNGRLKQERDPVDEPRFETIRGLFTDDGRLLSVWSEKEDDPEPWVLWGEYGIGRGQSAFVFEMENVPFVITQRMPLTIVIEREQYEWGAAMGPFAARGEGMRIVSQGGLSKVS